jgi:hypothetical protein
LLIKKLKIMMKKILKKIILIVFAISTFSCTDSDNVIYDVFDGMTHGAVLRTLEITSPTFDVVDLSSYFEVIIEEQDEAFGGLLSQVEVFIDAAGATEALVKTIAASEFAISSNGLPGTTIRITLLESLSALGLPTDGVACGDQMQVRLKVDLTDGRSFSFDDGSGSLQGSYFQSPYKYNVNVVANLPSETLYTGQYMLETVTPGIFGVGDYADGVYTVDALSNTIRVIRGVTTFPAFGGFGPVDVQFDFVCGEIILPDGQGVGAGCGGEIVSGEAAVNSTYDLNNPDDSSFIINFTSDTTSDCVAPTPASFRLTKL